MSQMNRRQFVLTVAATAAAACCAAETAEAARPLPKGPFDCGPKTDYDKDGVTDKFAKKERILVIRHEGKIYAPTATCVHKNCAVKLKGDEIVCPCHGSRYSIEGTSTKGPAKGSLYRYAIKLDGRGHIIVDRDQQFEEKKWDDPAAWIKA
jgi:nitrite reductase/ring-hydroxylating ferredoxin subunit